MQPTYRLTTPIGEGDATKWKEIGAAWVNKDGSIAVVLNAYVTVDHTVKMLMYPWTSRKAKAEKKSTDG